jgi:hypothetical protein
MAIDHPKPVAEPMMNPPVAPFPDTCIDGVTIPRYQKLQFPIYMGKLGIPSLP